MFKFKDVADKYELVGSPIRHVEGQGVMDLSQINLKAADYLHERGCKGLKLKEVKKPVDDKSSKKA